MKGTSSGLRVPVAGSALTVAVCAAFGAGPAEATLTTIPVDVLLGTYDFDVGGTTVFTFSRNDTSSPPFFGFENDVNTYGNYVVGFASPPVTAPKPGTYASLLHGGELIDGSRTDYVSGSNVILSGAVGIPGVGGESYGEFYGQSGYAGLKFNLSGESGFHYGYALLQDPPGDLTVISITYETQQNLGVVTPALPEPGSLALLAAGAAGVLALRRRKQAAS
jgi:hypothetical protein